jgi:hypothetical protein
MWRCPHCGTPQAETARCWVCRRSSTACGTCRNFRRSVAGSLGYCGLDRQRQPLTGDEIRACWEAAAGSVGEPLAATASAGSVGEPLAATTSAGTTGDDAPAPGRAAPLEFIEVHGRLAAETVPPSVEPPEPDSEVAAPSSDSPAFVSPPLQPSGEPGWSLWGDPDR